MDSASLSTFDNWLGISYGLGLRVWGTNSLAYWVCSGGGLCRDGGYCETRGCEETLCTHDDLQVDRSERILEIERFRQITG